MPRATPTPEALLQMWKAVAQAGPHPAAIAEALARGVAMALGDVGGVRYRLPDGRWRAVVYAPDPAGFSRTDAEGPAPSPGEAEAPWLQAPPFTAERLGARAVAPLSAGGRVLGSLAVARLRDGAGAGAFEPEERALLSQLAEAAAASLAQAEDHGRLLAEQEPLQPAAPWMVAFARDCPGMVFLKDRAGRYVLVNDTFVQFSRTTIEKVIGKTDEEIYPKEQAAFFRSIDRQIIATNKPAITCDRFFIGGEWKVFLACKFPVRDAEGEVAGVGGHVTPVPDEKVSSEALARGEEQLNFITDALPELMAYVDMTERFRFANRAYNEWFGQDRNEIIGKPVRAIFGEETYKILKPYLHAGLAGKPGRFDLKLLHRDGAPRDVRVTLAPQRNFTHEVEGVVLLISDITEQKMAEERLRFLDELGGRLHSRLDDVEAESGAPLKMVAALSVLKLADWSVIEMRGADGQLEQLAAAHTDVEKTALLRKLHQWLAREDQPLHIPRVLVTEKAELFGEITDQQLRETVNDPEVLRLFQQVGLRSAMVVPVTTRNGTIGALVLATGPSRRPYDQSDLTQAVELARRAALATDNADLFHQMTRAIELRDNFLATASHELRTPLTSLGLHLDALMMEVQLLTRKVPDLARFSEGLTRAMNHSERLGGLIRQLLDVARMREGTQVDLIHEEVDLGKLASDVADRFSDEAARAQCTVEVRRPEKPVKGWWDAFRLDQAATNLIGNAIKYGGGKPIQVEISAADGTATLTVRDQGIGIAPEDHERIFKKFERAVSSRHYGGLGLGLWISRQAVEAMGGTIRVQSQPGEETTFTVELPLDSRPR